MAGYSGKTLVQKIGLKAGHRLALIGEPDGFINELAPLPEGVAIVGGGKTPLDCVILFADEARTLKSRIVRWGARLAPAGMLWVTWPKKASKVVTDVTEALVRDTGLDSGLVDVKICAVNNIWSGLKFVRRLKDR
ncbi:MAG: DUF3052 domain-containing protein [Vicinamibacterales bacterium]